MRNAIVLGFICTAALLGSCIPCKAAAAGPETKVVPSRVALRGTAIVTATHLRPQTIVTLLLAIPDIRRHRVEKLLGATHADSRGNVRVAVTIPLMTTCGAASIYVITTQTAQHLRSQLTITGCKARSSRGGPPAPPSPRKP